MCRVSCPFVVAIVVCGTVINFLSALNESGHRAQSCSFSGLCVRCRWLGQRARDCKRAWGSAPSVFHNVDVSPAPVSASSDGVTDASVSVPDPPVPVDSAPGPIGADWCLRPTPYPL